jgi:hypothetical protein
MEDLCSDLTYEQPQNINEFLIERLRLKQKQGTSRSIQDSRPAFSARRKLPTSLPSSISNVKVSSTSNVANKP